MQLNTNKLFSYNPFFDSNVIWSSLGLLCFPILSASYLFNFIISSYHFIYSEWFYCFRGLFLSLGTYVFRPNLLQMSERIKKILFSFKLA